MPNEQRILLEQFRPGCDNRFLWCCGGYRRWELEERGARRFWQLASDWGQATVAGFVTPRRDFALEVEFDLSQLPQGELAVTLCSRLRVGKLGVDGLQFYATPVGRVHLSQERLTFALDGREAASAPGPVELSVAPASLSWCVDAEGTASLRVGNVALTAAGTHPDAPCFLLLSGNTGAPDPRGRFGEVTLWSSAARG